MKSLLPFRRKSPLASTKNHQIQTLHDIFNCLPVELLLAIFAHLSTPADVLSALNVCRAWRCILLSADIWPALAERLVPGLASHIRASSATPAENGGELGVLEREQAEGRAFHSALLLQHLRSSGYPCAATHYTLRLNLASSSSTPHGHQPFTLSKSLPLPAGGVHSLSAVPGLDSNPAAEAEQVARLKLYSHGRVAWWPEGWHLPYFAVVDDLQTQRRRMYLFPFQTQIPVDSGGFHAERRGAGNGGGLGRGEQTGWKTAIGEVLFVMGQENAGVCVWHLQRDEMRRVELPGAFDRCVMQGERLLFVGRRAAEVWLWSWGTSESGIEVVDAAAQGCYYNPGPVTMGGQMVLGDPRPAPKVGLRFRDTDVKLDFILHPTDPDVMFVVTYNEVDLVVHQLTAGRATERIVLPRGHAAFQVLQRAQSTGIVYYLRQEPCDAHGGYCLVTAWLGLDRFCSGGCVYAGSIGSVVFNVYNKRFSALVHHAVYQRTPDTHLWDGLLAVGVQGSHGQPRGDDAGSLELAVVLLKPCDGHAPPSSSPLRPWDRLPVRRTVMAAQTSLCFFTTPSTEDDGMHPRPQQLDRVAYALATGSDGTYGLSDLGWLGIMTAEWLSGDDKTLIYVTGKEYTVWRFGEEDGGSKVEDKKGGQSWKDRWRKIVDRNGLLVTNPYGRES